jgi:hypothetical protein
MKKHMKILGVLFINILIIAICSCKNQDPKIKFALEEEAEIKSEAEKIINEFGYNNYKIFTYFHKEIGKKLYGRQITSNKAVGSGLLPLFDQLTDSSGFAAGMTNSFDGYFEHRAITENYDSLYPEQIAEITYDYLSIIIIFDKISPDQKNELLKLLNIYIANSNRGDIIYIISRNEMQNNITNSETK